mgnify:CR=1 FL=1
MDNDLFAIFRTIIPVKTHRPNSHIPITIAHALMKNLGTRLHQSTTLIPHRSAIKLNGIVTIKSGSHVSTCVLHSINCVSQSP